MNLNVKGATFPTIELQAGESLRVLMTNEDGVIGEVFLGTVKKDELTCMSVDCPDLFINQNGQYIARRFPNSVKSFTLDFETFSETYTKC